MSIPNCDKILLISGIEVESYVTCKFGGLKITGLMAFGDWIALLENGTEDGVTLLLGVEVKNDGVFGIGVLSGGLKRWVLVVVLGTGGALEGDIEK